MFAPNAGVSLSTGGGNAVLCRLAEVLAEDFDCDVVLAGYHAFSLQALDQQHGTHLSKIGERVRVWSAGFSGDLYRRLRVLPAKLSSYNLLFSRNFSKWVRETFERIVPSAVWFNDDIPLCAERYLKDKEVYVYVHYPLLGRRSRIAPPLSTERGLMETLNDTALLWFAGSLVLESPQDYAQRIFANSSVTLRAIRTAWLTTNVEVLHPFYQREREVKAKKDLLISVGAIQKQKRYEDLIKPFMHVCNEYPSSKLHVYGSLRDKNYYTKLRRLSANGNRGHVQIFVDASRILLTEGFAETKAIFQLGLFEPFGLSLLEGMSYGAVAISRESEFSGAWVDILERGKWGKGFRNDKDAEEIMRSILGDASYVAELSEAASRRAESFSREKFLEQLQRRL